MAVIAGAGVAGLSNAWWLTQAGWRVVVVERAADLRDGGYMMGLSGPGLHTARNMGLVPALRAVEHDIRENIYRDRHGREIMRIRYRDLLEQLDWITLRRSDLVRVLHEAVRDRCELRLPCTVQQWQDNGEKVQVSLSDGSHWQADLLIGADGVHSTLRSRAFASRYEALGYRYAAYDLADTLGLAPTSSPMQQSGSKWSTTVWASSVWRFCMCGAATPAGWCPPPATSRAAAGVGSP
ncbi:FAD binding domain protein [Bordetella holmesii 44057]|nr:FAD binding domain protein [Bordetella holmesii 44057]EWM40477.1 FAD binding domain protein [Bordetella holmesii 35009]